MDYSEFEAVLNAGIQKIDELTSNWKLMGLRDQYNLGLYLVLNTNQKSRGIKILVDLYRVFAFSTDEDYHEECNIIGEIVQNEGNFEILHFLQATIKFEREPFLVECFTNWKNHLYEKLKANETPPKC